MEESVGPEGLEFKWGKKKSVGGKNKDVQFYESFTYDGDEYCLHDCVLVGDAQSTEPFIGMIIKIWEHANKLLPRRVKLLWFFKPSEISPYLEGVPDILENELFLASGEGIGLANVNQLEAIGGKCSVLCISNDKRNPQPSDEEVNSADFVFRRTFDVGSCKVVDTIDDKIAGVDVFAVKSIFNRVCCQKKATAMQKVEAGINGNSDSLKPNGRLATTVSVRKIRDSSTKSYNGKESGYGCSQEKVKGHNQLATEKSTFAEERSNNDFGSRGNLCDGKAQESEVKKQYSKQKSMPAEDRYRNSCEASGSRVIHFNSKKTQVNDVKRQLTKQKSMPTKERYKKELNEPEHRPPKKQKLDGSVTVPDGRNTTIFQNITSNGEKDTGSFKRPRDKVRIEEDPPNIPRVVQKRDLEVSVSEGKDTKTVTEKGLSKKHSFERAEDRILVVDNERNYQVFEVSRRPDAEKIKWFQNLPWEESMRDAEKKGTVVLLQNLDTTYTSDEVEDIIYSALNEKCEARMIERTSVTIPHIGEALAIFKTREVAERVIERLDEGCLLLSNGRPLVAAFAKITPPGKPSSFFGHIKLHKTQTRREMVLFSLPLHITHKLKYIFCLYMFSREMPWLHHIVHSRTILNLTWRWNGACTKPDTSRLLKHYLSGNGRRKSHYGFTSSRNLLSFRIICFFLVNITNCTYKEEHKLYFGPVKDGDSKIGSVLKNIMPWNPPTFDSEDHTDAAASGLDWMTLL